ncbi:hypothetical protein CF651_31525 [Paenibacillus rigui]|uniref:Uncharacterized protein n=1 Tax=Paenibacillus rigui TaxID=554312 RepID=A0A229UG53_9BACL|nr:hypothetical protein CF651_31525 [Paenibacillus rigui]
MGAALERENGRCQGNRTNREQKWGTTCSAMIIGLTDLDSDRKHIWEMMPRLVFGTVIDVNQAEK